MKNISEVEKGQTGLLGITLEGVLDLIREKVPIIPDYAVIKYDSERDRLIIRWVQL